MTTEPLSYRYIHLPDSPVLSGGPGKQIKAGNTEQTDPAAVKRKKRGVMHILT